MTARPWQIATAIIAVMAAALIGYIGYQRYTEDYTVTKQDDGQAITEVITARLTGARSLKVATLNGTVQSTASDVRGFGMLKTGRVIKMPYSVDYFVDVSRIAPGDLSWSQDTRTLVVNAPDVTVAQPNVDEARRTLVRTDGLYVTREAGEALGQRTSQNAQNGVRREAMSPERMAQAREQARGAVAEVMRLPLDSVGYRNARIVVTFPGERNDERMDRSRSLQEVYANAQ